MFVIQQIYLSIYIYIRGDNLLLEICKFVNSICSVDHIYHDKDESLLKAGVFDVFHDAIDAFHDAIDAFCDAIDAFHDAIDAFHDAIDAFYDAIDAFHDAIDAFNDASVGTETNKSPLFLHFSSFERKPWREQQVLYYRYG